MTSGLEREVSLDCWDYSIELECLSGPQDLQLAAELGKTLLERNKELETSLRQHQNVIEDQTQEIEYLTKQTAALREVNDSRLRIYEQLEVSIQDLERANQRLSLDNSADKKQIKSLGWQVESLEGRCEELTRQLDELQVSSRHVAACVASPVQELPTSPASDEVQVATLASQQEQHELLVTLQEVRSQRARDRHRLQELEEQLAALLQENACLEEHVYGLQQKEEDVKSLQEELSSLEELRQEGQLCRRCLRIADDRSQHAEDDDDEISIIDSLVSESQRNSVLQQLQESLGDSFHGDNPYRVLVEKYEELLKVQRQPGVMRVLQPTVTNNCLTLQEELQMSGEFDTFPGSKVNGGVNVEEAKLPRKGKLTPTDFSETETSSSGFSDETSNKGTQTDTHFLPGSFLCTISDGEDCRFSIYDDASPVESRFRKTPEYRQLFREIFDVLKRAAEAKDEGEKLPLLDDFTPVCEEPPKVPPVTPAREDNPGLRNEGEESEDDLSFGIVSEVQKGAEVLEVLEVESATGQAVSVKSEVEAVAEEDKKKSTNDILEYFASGSYKKKSNKKHSSKSAAVATTPADPVVGLNAKVLYTNKVMRRRKERPSDSPSRTPDRSTWCVAGSEMSERETKRQSGLWGSDLPPPSAASQEVAKLRMLEKSYAEVLRLGRQKVARQQRK